MTGITSETYDYDGLGRLIIAMDNDSNDLTFSYDALSRLTSETQSILGGTGQTVIYEYDDASRLTKITAPSGKDTTYAYDVLGRNTTITSSANTIATYSYTGVLNTGVVYGNGENIAYDYDALLRLASLDNGVQNYSYTYDDVSNITSDGTKDYSYDNLYRLTNVATTASGTTLENYNYDDAGNRVTDQDNTYTTNNLNQYLSLSGAINTSYTYDYNGNIISDGVKSFEYDYKNRLVKVSEWNEIIVEFTYDVLGRRIEKKTDTETIQYVYANKNILEENTTKSSGTFQKTYINGIWLDNLVAYIQEQPGLTFSEQEELEFCELRVIPYETQFNSYSWTNITSRCNNLTSSGSIIVENTYYFHKNHLWSVVWITDASWVTVSEYDYDSFGNFTLSGYDTGNTRLFTWREYDEEINLYYLRARYYDSQTGRFISRDPIWQVDDVNLYAYVGNNPLGFIDLHGLAAKEFVKAYDSFLESKSKYLSFRSKYNDIKEAYGEYPMDIGRYEYTYNRYIFWEAEMKKREGIAKKLHYARNDFQPIHDLPSSQYEAHNNGWEIMSNKRSTLHQVNVPERKWNQKWVSEDWLREVVFHYETNKLVLDETNMWTYNFFSPDDWSKHIKYDVNPYKEWWNWWNDKSNVDQRSCLTRSCVITNTK